MPKLVTVGTWLAGLAALSSLFGLVALAVDPQTITVTRGAGGAFNVSDSAGPVGMIGGFLGFAAMVLGLIWCYRVAARARALSHDGKPSPGWALGSWFIPVAHIVLPFLPLWTAWQRMGGARGPFVVWAVLWGGSLLLSYIGAIVGFTFGLDLVTGQPVDSVVTYDLPGYVVAVAYAQAIATAGAAAMLGVLVLETKKMEQAASPASPAQTPAQRPW